MSLTNAAWRMDLVRGASYTWTHSIFRATLQSAYEDHGLRHEETEPLRDWSNYPRSHCYLEDQNPKLFGSNAYVLSTVLQAPKEDKG